MASIYGARFLDMWRDVNRTEAETMWTQAMHGMSDEAIRRGIAKLFHTPKPPTLPEWIALCAPEPAMYRQHHLALTDDRRTSPEQAREQLARIRELANGILQQHEVPTGRGIRWAYQLLQRAAQGEPITAHQIGSAKDAIEAYAPTHGTMQRDRIPGSDDE